jgi:hypothetical protein
MRYRHGLPAAGLGALLLCACAAEPTVGRDTREWLTLQKGGAAASTEAPAMSGEVADKVYKRYVDSYGHPLPEQFPREDFTGSGESQSGGGQ